jgi:DNA polymerase elongation subunit (family B)
MSETFHILDALSRDQYIEITRETEEEQEVTLSWEDPDVSYGTSESNKKKCSMVIHLFGMTADGESLRCDVEGFRPYLYVKGPGSIDAHQFKDRLGKDKPASLSVIKQKRKEKAGK